MGFPPSEPLVFLILFPYFSLPYRFEGLGLGGSFRIWTAAAQMMKGPLKTLPNLGRELPVVGGMCVSRMAET